VRIRIWSRKRKVAFYADETKKRGEERKRTYRFGRLIHGGGWSRGTGGKEVIHRCFMIRARKKSEERKKQTNGGGRGLEEGA